MDHGNSRQDIEFHAENATWMSTKLVGENVMPYLK